MSKQREALEMALQALEEIATNYPADWELDICVYAKNLLREALAEPDQEPTTDGELYAAFLMGLHSKNPTRKPLNNPELWAMWVESPSDVICFARAIERAHGITE